MKNLLDKMKCILRNKKGKYNSIYNENLLKKDGIDYIFNKETGIINIDLKMNGTELIKVGLYSTYDKLIAYCYN